MCALERPCAEDGRFDYGLLRDADAMELSNRLTCAIGYQAVLSPTPKRSCHSRSSQPAAQVISADAKTAHLSDLLSSFCVRATSTTGFILQPSIADAGAAFLSEEFNARAESFVHQCICFARFPVTEAIAYGSSQRSSQQPQR